MEELDGEGFVGTGLGFVGTGVLLPPAESASCNTLLPVTQHFQRTALTAMVMIQY
jgi:hypothetical protein